MIIFDGKFSSSSYTCVWVRFNPLTGNEIMGKYNFYQTWNMLIQQSFGPYLAPPNHRAKTHKPFRMKLWKDQWRLKHIETNKKIANSYLRKLSQPFNMNKSYVFCCFNVLCAALATRSRFPSTWLKQTNKSMRANPFPPLVGQPFSVLSAPLFSHGTHNGKRHYPPGQVRGLQSSLVKTPKLTKTSCVVQDFGTTKSSIRKTKENSSLMTPHPHCHPTFIRVQSAQRGDTQLTEEETPNGDETWPVSGCRSQWVTFCFMARTS